MSTVCFTDLRSALSGVVDKDDLESLVKDINEKAEFRMRTNMEPKAKAMGATVDELLEQAKQNRQIKKMQSYLNILNHKELTTTIDAFDRKGLGLISVTGGTVKNTKAGINEGRFSVDAFSKAMSARLLSGLFKDIKYNAEHKDLWEILHSKQHEGELAKELFQPGSSANPKIKAIGAHVRDAYERSRKMLNSVGAHIGQDDSRGYLGHMIHDAQLMQRPFESLAAGAAERLRALKNGVKDISAHMNSIAYERWKNTIAPLLDHDATFQGADKEEFLKGVWESRVSGVRKTPYVTTEEGDKFRLPSPGNKADRLSRQRVLIWKDADSELAYIKSYGHGSLFKTIESTLLAAGRDYGIMRRFGPNPMAMWNRIKKETLEKARMEKRINFNSSLAEKILRGIVQGDRTESRVLANVCSNARVMVSMARLGRLVKWQIQDIGWRLTKMKSMGVPASQTYADVLRDNFSPMGIRQRKMAGDITGIWARNAQGSAFRNFAAVDTPGRRISQVAELYFKYTGVEYLDNMNRTGVAAATARYLARERGKEHGSLNEGLQRSLKAYGINEKEWDLFRKNAQTAPGRKLFITPDSVWMASKESIAEYAGVDAEKMSEQQEWRTRQELDNKFSTFFMDTVDDAHPQPNQYEKRLLVGNTERGGIYGELARTFSMFKLWNISSTRRGLGNTLFGRGKDGLASAILSGGGAPWLLASFAANMVMLTYLTEVVGALMENKTPPVFDNPKMVAKLLFESGLGGYYSTLFSDDYSITHTAAEGIGGPMVGAIDDIFNLLSATKNAALGEQEWKSANTAATNLFMNNMPGINTWYLRPALDFMLLNAWHEQNHPGYFWKKNEKMLEQTGQQYIFNPLALSH